MKNRDAGPIREMAEKLTAAGADYLDVNLGPARKKGDELMDWIVGVVQEVSDLPLYLDMWTAPAFKLIKPGNELLVQPASAQAGSFVHVTCDDALPMRRPLSIMRVDAAAGEHLHQRDVVAAVVEDHLIGAAAVDDGHLGPLV